jgi:DNA-binding beta-propeller fold protein YncE
VSYNRPRFNNFSTWSTNGISVATAGTVGGYPHGIFISKNNTMYVANREQGRVQIWLEGQNVPTSNITTGLYFPYSLFVTANDDIYVDNGYAYNSIVRWRLTSNTSESVMYVKRACYGVFIDTSNTLYCSADEQHQVAAKSLQSNSSMWIVAAGTDCQGSLPNQLSHPRGLFVDTNFDLYVADCGNNRVQLFRSNNATGMTVAGSGASETITLSCPSAVILDADGYLYISDTTNHRVVASGPNGFRCLLACMGAGSGPNQLYNPMGISFDSYGNLFVVDRENHRVQKFKLAVNISTRKFH